MTRDLIRSREANIIAEFAALPDVEDRFMHLFQLGLELPPLDPALKTEANQVRGCQSELWFHLEDKGGRLQLAAESDSMVISGIAALLARIVDGCPPQDLDALSLDFIDRLEITKLPSQRNNSLVAMLDHLKAQACGLQGQKGQGDSHA